MTARFTTQSTVITLSETMAQMINYEATAYALTGEPRMCGDDGWLEVRTGEEAVVCIGKKYIRGFVKDNPVARFYVPIEGSVLGTALLIEAKRAMAAGLVMTELKMNMFHIQLERRDIGGLRAEVNYCDQLTGLSWMTVDGDASQPPTPEELTSFNEVWKETFGGLVSYDGESLRKQYPQQWAAFSSGLKVTRNLEKVFRSNGIRRNYIV